MGARVRSVFHRGSLAIGLLEYLGCLVAAVFGIITGYLRWLLTMLIRLIRWHGYLVQRETK